MTEEHAAAEKKKGAFIFWKLVLQLHSWSTEVEFLQNKIENRLLFILFNISDILYIFWKQRTTTPGDILESRAK